MQELNDTRRQGYRDVNEVTLDDTETIIDKNVLKSTNMNQGKNQYRQLYSKRIQSIVRDQSTSVLCSPVRQATIFYSFITISVRTVL